MIINVFTVGNSKDINTWSGIPFFVANSLENNGVKINRLDISIKSNIVFLYENTITKIINNFYKLTGKHSVYNFSISRLCYYLTNQKIKKYIKFYHADYNLFLTFSFSSKTFSDTPVILLSDMTLDRAIKIFYNRLPNIFEEFIIKKLKKHFKEADIIAVLFPILGNHISDVYKADKRKIFYLGKGINLLKKNECIEEMLNKKTQSKTIFFIGRDGYIDGAKLLLETIEILTVQRKRDIKLKIIGLKENLFPKKYKNVEFYGYLRKDCEDELKVYLEILKNSKFLVNPSKWNAPFYSSIEAMYYFNPIIIPKNEEYTRVFGKIDNIMGYELCENDFEKNKLADKIEYLFDNETVYLKMATNAYNKVKDFTWDSSMSKLLQDMKAI